MSQRPGSTLVRTGRDGERWRTPGDSTGQHTHFDVELHLGDEQFKVDTAQLSISLTQVTLGAEGRGVGERRRSVRQGEEEISIW